MSSFLLNEITQLYASHGNTAYMIGEKITQSSHALQAAYIAKLAGAPEDVMIGLLLHDIGQIVLSEHLGNTNYLHTHHDELGAMWLENQGFPSFVCDVARFHTLAKVVLCSEDSAYFDSLSQASKESCLIQREKYLSDSYRSFYNIFLNHPRLSDIKCARLCDDMAKVAGINPMTFDTYFAILERVCKGQVLAPISLQWQEKIRNFYIFMLNDPEGFEKWLREQAIENSSSSI